MSDEQQRFAVFVSHNTADESLAMELNDEFARNGLKTYLAQDELHRKPGGAVQAACLDALSRSQAMLVCIGPGGIGPSQDIEITTAYELEKDGSLEVIVVLMGTATRDDIPSRHALLRAKFSYVFPPRPRSPGVREIIASLKRCTPADSPPMLVQASVGHGAGVAGGEPAASAARTENFAAEAERAAEQLADSLVEYGLTVFVGSIWPERGQPSFFNPNEVACSLLDEVGIPVSDANRVMSLDRAMLCYTIVKARGKTGEKKVENDILARINRSFSLSTPAAYGVLPGIAKKVRELAGNTGFDGGSRPLLLATTNVDRLIERSLLREGQPLLRLAAHCDGTFEETLFERVTPLGDGCLRIETEASNGGGRESTETVAWREADLDRQPAAIAAAYSARRSVLTEQTSQEVWRDLQIDNAISTHHRKVGRSYAEKAEDTRRLQRSLSFASENGIPVLFKMFGCIDSNFERALGLNRMLQFSRNPGWIPQEIRTAFGTTASLFLGYSFADIRFVHLYEQVLDGIFDKNAYPHRVLVSSSQAGPHDGLREVDVALMEALHNVPDDRFRGLIPVVDEPAQFLNRMLRRDLGASSAII